MADKMPRRKTVSVSFDDDGNARIALYTTPDDAGKQTVAETLTLAPSSIHASLVAPFALRGVADTLRNIINRLDNPSPDQSRAEYDRFIATVTNGTWQPGRTLEASEPDDIAYALAEVTGVPVDTIVAKLEEMLEEPKRDAAGNVMYDKRTPPRVIHVWTRSKLYAEMEASDPRVKTALSKIIAERARRLAAEARGAKASGTSLSDLFGAPAAAQPVAAK